MRSVLLVVVAVLIVVPGLAVLVTYVVHRAGVDHAGAPVAASPARFSVGGHSYSCGDDGTVTLTVAFSYPGPTHGAFLDGVKLADRPGDSPGGAYFPVAEPTTFSCDRHGMHHVRQDVGRTTEHYVGCGITSPGAPSPARAR